MESVSEVWHFSQGGQFVSASSASSPTMSPEKFQSYNALDNDNDTMNYLEIKIIASRTISRGVVCYGTFVFSGPRHSRSRCCKHLAFSRSQHRRWAWATSFQPGSGTAYRFLRSS